MKKFAYKALNFSVFTILSIFFIGGVITQLQRIMFEFDIPKNKTSLVIGDSHLECAIDDKILSNTFNFSQSGSGYFYSYLKLKKVLADNPQIDKVLLSYTYDDMEKSKDEWFSGSEIIKFKMPVHLFLFDYTDFFSLFISNPYQVAVNFPRAITVGIGQIAGYMLPGFNLDNWGKYRRTERDKLREAKIRYKALEGNDNLEYSTYQQEYLMKIYNLTAAKNIKLYLLNTPIHPILENGLEEYKDYYYSFIEQNLPKATIINHSKMIIPEYGFGDLEHLNHKGAKMYSEYLKEHGFSTKSGGVISPDISSP